MQSLTVIESFNYCIAYMLCYRVVWVHCRVHLLRTVKKIYECKCGVPLVGGWDGDKSIYRVILSAWPYQCDSCYQCCLLLRFSVICQARLVIIHQRYAFEHTLQVRLQDSKKRAIKTVVSWNRRGDASHVVHILE